MDLINDNYKIKITFENNPMIIRKINLFEINNFNDIYF